MPLTTTRLAGNKFYLDAGAEALSAAGATKESKAAAALAQSAQVDLEKVVLDCVAELKAISGLPHPYHALLMCCQGVANVLLTCPHLRRVQLV